MSANPKSLVVRFDGERVFNVVTDNEITGELPFGKKGTLTLEHDENGLFFVYVDGAGNEVYILALHTPGEFLLTTAIGEWLPSDEEKAAIHEATEFEAKLAANKRKAERQETGAGWAAYNTGTRTHHAANEPFVTEIDNRRAHRWDSDGTVERKSLGNGYTEITIIGATWARFHPYHLHVWPGFKPDDEFIRTLGIDVIVTQDMLARR